MTHGTFYIFAKVVSMIVGLSVLLVCEAVSRHVSGETRRPSSKQISRPDQDLSRKFGSPAQFYVPHKRFFGETRDWLLGQASSPFPQARDFTNGVFPGHVIPVERSTPHTT